MLEFTYVMIKPDIMNKEENEKNRIIEDIINTYNDNGLDIITMDEAVATYEQVSKHYEHLKDKPFFNDLASFMSDKILKMIVFGEDAVKKVRDINGPTNVLKAREESPNSIRAKYGNPDFGPANAVHASDSKESAINEIYNFYNIKINQPKYANDQELRVKQIVSHKHK